VKLKAKRFLSDASPPFLGFTDSFFSSWRYRRTFSIVGTFQGRLPRL